MEVRDWSSSCVYDEPSSGEPGSYAVPRTKGLEGESGTSQAKGQALHHEACECLFTLPSRARGSWPVPLVLKTLCEHLGMLLPSYS